VCGGRARGTVPLVRADVLTMERPTWRGWFHVGAFVAAIPAGVLLIVAADRASGRVAAAIYAASLLLVFGTSAAYHRLAQSLRARQIMRRLDHSMIYLLIAGTYVPLCIVALPDRWGIPLLAVVGAFAVVGVVIKLAGVARLQVVGDVLYPVTGWAAIVAAPALRAYLTPVQHRARGGRGRRLHDRLPCAHAAPARSVAAGLRVPRDLARVHDRRRDAALRRRRDRRRLTGQRSR
jgi:hemolysin III